MTETEALSAFRHVVTGKKSKASFQALAWLSEFAAAACASLFITLRLSIRYSWEIQGVEGNV